MKASTNCKRTENETTCLVGSGVGVAFAKDTGDEVVCVVAVVVDVAEDAGETAVVVVMVVVVVESQTTLQSFSLPPCRLQTNQQFGISVVDVVDVVVVIGILVWVDGLFQHRITQTIKFIEK